MMRPVAPAGVVLLASVAAFLLARLSAVAGCGGGGVLLLPVFTALFGLRVAVPVLTLTQLSSNGSRPADRAVLPRRGADSPGSSSASPIA